MFSDVEDDIDGDADLATVAPPIQALDGQGNLFHTITAETVIFDKTEYFANSTKRSMKQEKREDILPVSVCDVASLPEYETLSGV